MHKTITPSQMKRVETLFMQRSDVKGETLMARAAAGVARQASALLRTHSGLALCLCGVGNNGGDGLCATRLLAAGDEAFTGECWIPEGALSPDAQRELKRLQEEQPQVSIIRLTDDVPPLPPRTALVIDALFGTGLSRPITGTAAELCRRADEARRGGASVLAVDIPSGLCGETGEVRGAAVHADVTVTFHRSKPGLYLGQGLDYAGKVLVCGIGVPPEYDDADGLWMLEKRDLSRLLPARRRVSHKGSYGRVLLWVGSRGMAGAAAISATAALRAGAGLVTVACPSEILDTVQMLCPCATCAPLDMTDTDAAWVALRSALMRADTVGAGCGLGQSQAVAALLERFIQAVQERGIPCVLDADALNCLAARGGHPSLGERFTLTPHPAEAARLLSKDTADIVRDPISAATALRDTYGASVILKGAASVLMAREGAAINSFGSPAMAKGGSGDALTGVLAALLAGRAAGAYAFSDLEALQAACALHGLAGEQAARLHGERGALATDLCGCLGTVDLRDEPAEPDMPAPTDQHASPLGLTVTVTVDRKLGSAHPKHPELIYELNYGYVQEVLAGDNDWQDVYIYGVDKPLEWFEGEVVAVIRRRDDVEDKWVAAQKGTRLTPDEVRRATNFQERFFDIEIECL